MKVTKRILLRRIGRQLAINRELLTNDRPQLHSQHRPAIPEVMRDNQTAVQLSLLQGVGGAPVTNAGGYVRE